MPAAIYVETNGGIAVGGSDDHAGIDIGRTYTQTPHASTPEEFLAHVREGRAAPAGEQGSTEKWAHAAMALTVRALGHDGERTPVDPARVLEMAERLLSEGDRREGAAVGGVAPADARALLRAWLASVDLDHLSESDLVAYMQDDGFTHAGLLRRATRAHERRLRAAVETALDAAAAGTLAGVGGPLFAACIPAIPYAPAAAFLARERAKLASREGEQPRIAVVTDGIGAMHGVTRTIEEIRERGIPGFEIEVIGTDRNVDRRLPAVADVEIPHYPGMTLGVPSLPAVVEAIALGRYDAIHVCSPGPSGVAAALLARAMEIPLIGSYHTELAAYAGLRSGDPTLESAAKLAIAAFYAQCRLVLSPSRSADEALAALGITASRIARWDRGVDVARFDPARRRQGEFPGAFNVLYAGRISTEKNIDLLADAFVAAHAADSRLHLVLAGGGPEQPRLAARLGARATFLGWLEGDELAGAYASADAFCFPSETDTFGQVVLEAKASGLPVVAVAAGGPRDLIDDGVDGVLVEPRRDQLASALLSLVAAPGTCARLGGAARRSVEERTWERALERLADGYREVLGSGAAAEARDAA